MSSEPIHHRKEKKKYSVVLIPSGESSKTKTFSFGRISAFVAIITTFFVIVVLVALTLLFTPARGLLPIPHAELEQRYGRQIVGIQRELNSLLLEMVTLRTYNLRLRKALGENVNESDTSGLIASEIDRTVRTRTNENGTMNRNQDLRISQNNVRSVPREIPYSQNKVGTANLRSTEFPLVLPADGFVSRGFDMEQKHFGIDIAGKEGSAVMAGADGNVVFAGWTYDDGYLMILAHAQGYMTIYKHNQVLLQSTGSNVKRGDVIALLGNTGKTSSGPHLHFEVWKDGIVRNPDNYLLITQ